MNDFKTMIFVRETRDKIYKETKNKSKEEIRNYYKEKTNWMNASIKKNNLKTNKTKSRP